MVGNFGEERSSDGSSVINCWDTFLTFLTLPREKMRDLTMLDAHPVERLGQSAAWKRPSITFNWGKLGCSEKGWVRDRSFEISELHPGYSISTFSINTGTGILISYL